MKLTLAQKREIVRFFKRGETTLRIADKYGCFIVEIEQVIRDFMNGKFKLRPTAPACTPGSP